MLSPIILLTSLGFAVWYPLSFWLSKDDPLKDNFACFHLGLPVFVGGAATIWALFLPLPIVTKGALVFWIVLLMCVAGFFWSRETPDLIVLTLPCLIGSVTLLTLQSYFLSLTVPAAVSTLLGGAIVAAAAYAMNLGHWYLNVHGLPIKHLVRAVRMLWLLLALRLAFDLVSLAAGHVDIRWDSVPLLLFLWSLEGFGLIIAISFGTIFPLVANYFVMGTLKVKSTQSATGILYVILCAVLIGEIAYRFYLIKYGVGL